MESTAANNRKEKDVKKFNKNSVEKEGAKWKNTKSHEQKKMTDRKVQQRNATPGVLDRTGNSQTKSRERTAL